MVIQFLKTGFETTVQLTTIKSGEVKDRLSPSVYSIGIDRVDNSVGYLPSNCISCCSWCNRAKNNGTLANFVDKCKKIASRIELDDNYFDIGAERMRNHIKSE